MIAYRAHVLLKDDRKDLRVKENTQVPWQIKYKGRNGLAKVKNISTSGMLIETNRAFDLKDECIFSFDSDQGENAYIPQVGRLIWSKKRKFTRDKYLCGIKFVEADAKVLQRMRLRVANGVRQFIKERRVATILGLALCAVFAALVGFIAFYSSAVYRDITTANQTVLSSSGQQALLSQSMNNLYRANEIKIAQAEERLAIADQLIQDDKSAMDLFSKELEATKALLAQTETMLIEANDKNIAMSGELQALRGGGKVQAPVRVVNANLGAGQIESMAEAKALVSEYRVRIQSVKQEMGRLKAEEQAARAATLAQIERQKLELGNNGFFVRDGEAVWVNASEYQRLSIEGFSGAKASNANQNIEIDVTFVE